MGISQEGIALTIVWLAFLWILWRIFLTFLAGPIALRLLRQGYVKYAIWLRRKSMIKSKCSSGCSR